MQLSITRRPELILLAALAFLGAAVVIRTWIIRPSTPLPYRGLSVPAPVELGTEEMLLDLQDRLRLNPKDTAAYALLGLALLQQVRETGDVSLYLRAEEAFDKALAQDPQQLDALIGQGLLALARHRFAEALHWGEEARALNPYRAQVYGVIGDAQLELGQYEAAAETFQQMVDTRPDLNSYSRISYLRELHGDLPGAFDAMQRAVTAAFPGTEAALWTQVQLGHLYFNSGDLARAETAYRQALQMRPDYIYALAGLARLQAARGEHEAAIAAYQQIVQRLPLPEFVIALGELYEVTGQTDQAKNQYDLVRAMSQLNTEAGMNVDLEFALFNADQGSDPALALRQAQAAYQARPGIHGADTLAWAFYRHGDYPQAQRYSQEALRLGTQDALLHYHAGMIAYALGDKAGAQSHLQSALAINPYFSIRYTPQAQALLEELSLK